MSNCKPGMQKFFCTFRYLKACLESVSGVSDEEKGVVDCVAHQSRAPPELSGPSITVVVVGQCPVSQHHRDIRVRPLQGKLAS